jgi:hypothetical protein
MLCSVGVAVAATFAVALLQWASLREVDDLRVDAAWHQVSPVSRSL